jgi:hypothetical protein
MAASVWLTVGVTIDRFVYVKFPLWARGYCSVHRAKARIVFKGDSLRFPLNNMIRFSKFPQTPNRHRIGPI